MTVTHIMQKYVATENKHERSVCGGHSPDLTTQPVCNLTDIHGGQHILASAVLYCCTLTTEYCLLRRNRKFASHMHPHCFPSFLVGGPRLASRNNRGSSHPCSRKYWCPDVKYPKLKIYVSELIVGRYQYVPVAHVTMQCMI